MDRAAKIIQLEWAHNRNIFGQGIGVAVMDTGISPHPDFITPVNRITAFVDFISNRNQPYDDGAHGTHVAGIIGGNGIVSNGIYMGVAPQCSLIGVKVLDKKGNGNISDVLAGFQWIIENQYKYNIRVVNISVGTHIKDYVDEDSLLVKGVNEVWDAGIIVVAAAGNGGPRPYSIGAPGISRKIITVGACDDNVPVELSGARSVDYSGRGPTKACIKKPDIVAPGSMITSCNIIGNRTKKFYTIKSGTSMATPMVSGAIALLLSRYPQMSNREVKIRLKNSAKDLGLSHEKQGWGLLDISNMFCS